MTKLEFFGEFVKHEELDISISLSGFHNICNGVFTKGCNKCSLFDKCNSVFNDSIPKFNNEEFEEIKEQYPEYFI